MAPKADTSGAARVRPRGPEALTGTAPAKKPNGAFSRWWSDDVAATVDHEDVVERVRGDSGWSAHFAVMTLLSAGIAILGLLLSSPAVVIGAMLISPLMGPIVGAGFGIATFDTAELRRAFAALVGGILMAVCFCALIVLVSPLQTVTSEIASRTRPNLFDLLVALLSGLAGTYAVIRGRHGAIVGVAIATALMPPIAVMGFGIATTNWSVLSGASLLFFTNLMTIAAAAAAMARLYGFAANLSPRQTRLQIVLLLGSLALLAVPLGLALKRIAWEALATRDSKAAIAQAFGPSARVSDLNIDFDSRPVEIEATVLTPEYRRGVEESVGRILGEEFGGPVALTIDQVRTSDGDISSLEVAKPNSGAAQRNSSRLSQELAAVAGVDPEQVLVDASHKVVQVRAVNLPDATFDTYRELERRIAVAEPAWTVRLLPPPLQLPELDASASRAAAIDTAVWAASRLQLPVVLSGPDKEADAVEQQLSSRGVDVRRGRSTGPLSIAWDVNR